MKARGKRERSEARRPWVTSIKFRVALNGRNTCLYFGLSGLNRSRFIATQGRRVSLRSRLPLAFILRALRRSISTFCAKQFGQVIRKGTTFVARRNTTRKTR